MSVRQDPSTLKLTIEAPAEVLKGLPVRGEIRVALVDDELREVAVQGKVVFNRGRTLEVATSQRLPHIGELGWQLVFSSPAVQGSDCIEHWLGECYGFICVGTTYCLPGHGPDGFDCSCV